MTVIASCLSHKKYEQEFCNDSALMPGSMDGIGMAQQILKRRRDLPVVLASGYIVSPDRLNDPEVAFLAKPYSAEKLWEVLTGCACWGGA